MSKRRPLPFSTELKRAASVAQVAQDLWVLHETGGKTGGYFLEIGAFDGVKSSNTYLLEKSFAWHGILAEPNPTHHANIEGRRSAPNCMQCVWSYSGEKVDFLCTDESEYSTIKRFAADDHHAAKRLAYVSLQIETIALNDLLDRQKTPRQIDYISIDTEGSELDILSTFDFDRYDVQLFTIEHNYTVREAAIDALMVERRYERIHRDWSRWDAWHRKPRL